LINNNIIYKLAQVDSSIFRFFLMNIKISKTQISQIRTKLKIFGQFNKL